MPFLPLVVSLLFTLTSAHRGLLTKPSCDDDYGTSATALNIPDASISWAFKHYLDCTHRVVWTKFTNPEPDFRFYVGVGIPPVQRQAATRADALIIGPGLPTLSDADMQSLPVELQNDRVWSTQGGVGAVIHRSPQDQSSCAHLGTVMQGISSVVNGRCDFFEPFGQTHSWRVLDADNNVIPLAQQTYYVAVFLQQHTSGKLGIALGTWTENFWAPMEIATPTCVRDMSDFSEKNGDQTNCFPVVACPAVPPISKTTCEPRDASCPLGAVCSGSKDCCVAFNSMMGCGGECCQPAKKLWDDVNLAMHRAMALQFTGAVDVDFVRGMIPHHAGAVAMCDVLLLNLTCTPLDEAGVLDGLVHFCQHVKFKQETELGGMRAWLAARALQETSVCSSDGMAGHDGHMGMDGCGNTTTWSSQAFIAANRDMHSGMAINYTCDHSVDFIRQMIPHHAAAIVMCEILSNATVGGTTATAQPDAYLTELCANITQAQRAEIAWLSAWLAGRGKSLIAPCEACADGEPFTEPEMPCEDLLYTSQLCHLVGGDLNCKCATLTAQYQCGTTANLTGPAMVNPSAECRRTCGLCPAERPPLLPTPCPGPGGLVAKDATMGNASHGHGQCASCPDLHTHSAQLPLCPSLWVMLLINLMTVVTLVLAA
uniref:DUF305 domain-containing protein n=1 Tax=Eutreptiella gymnastica TaxID=73025 RepID=A0A7S1NL07_9EUGL